MTHFRSAATIVLAACLGACSADGDETQSEAPLFCAPPEIGAAFSVGTGEHCFEPLNDGDDISVVSGSQGGMHIWLSIACEDCSQTVALTYGIRDPATDEWLWGSTQQQMVNLLLRQAAGVTAMLPGGSFGSTSPADYLGRDLTLYAEVELDNGETLDDERLVTISGVEHQASACPGCN